MSHNWFHIAKAEFYVTTASMRNHRKLATVTLYALGVIWALYVAPLLVTGVLTVLIPLLELRIITLAILPGLMRSMMMFVWLMLFLFPLARGLEEIKIGHWEIFLSRNVKTSDMLSGSFLGWLPLNGFVTLILAPIVISPFMMILEVSLLGQVLVYLVVTVTVIAVLWLSSFTTAALQSKLGNSSRGNDIAKALAMVMGLGAVLPMYLIMYAAPLASAVLGSDIFMLMPFTWTGDAVSWLVLTFNGVGLTSEQIAAFSGTMPLSLFATVALVAGFALLTVGGTLRAADRAFTISAGARSERTTTVGRDNLILRGIRRIAAGSFGALVVVNMKDYFRKAQNLSKMAYGVILAVVLPLMMSQFSDFGEVFSWERIIMMMSFVFVMIGAMPFTGVGFLESKSQLWIIQGAPKGPRRYVKARLLMAAITGMVLTTLPVIVIAMVTRLQGFDIVMLWGFGCIMTVGSSMVGIGATARNPDYEDTKSPAHQANVMMAVMIPVFTLIGSTILLLVMSSLGTFQVVVNLFGPGAVGVIAALTGPLAVLAIGSMFVVSGVRNLSSPD